MRLLPAFCALVATTALAQYDETITVSRILVDVRVTAANGEAVPDLTAADFEVTLDGRPVVVQSATWVEEKEASSSPSGPGFVEPPASSSRDWIPYLAPAPGRLFILFIQTDFTRHSSRVKGQMKFRRYAEELIRSLAPEDRVAVFSFDSHLKLRRDFTADKDSVAAALEESILINHPPPPPAAAEPALTSRLDRKALRKATTSEKALKLIAEALATIDGPKSLILIGWGLGHRARGGTAVVMDHVWPAAFQALQAARVAIYVMDYTEADSHDLEHPLIQAAEQTGGFYAKTYTFPQAAIDRLRRTLDGYYMLELRAPAGMEAGSYALDVSVKRRGTMRIMFPQMVSLSSR
jgi:VWFA-related protein